MNRKYSVPSWDELLIILETKLYCIEYQIQQFVHNQSIYDAMNLETTVALNYIRKYKLKQVQCQNEAMKGWCEYGQACWFKHLAK